MATTYQSKQGVPSGYYFNASRWAIEPVAEDGAALPAGPGCWLRLPTAVALLATPVLGLAFLVFLPFIGFALTAQAAIAPVARLFQGATEGLAATFSPSYAVGASHLTGQDAAHGSVAERGPPPATLGRLLAAPFAGLAFVVALPVLAVAFVAHGLLRKLTGHVAEGARDLAASVTPPAATGAAHLAGHEGPPEAKAKEAEAQEAEEAEEATAEEPAEALERLAKELEEKRR